MESVILLAYNKGTTPIVKERHEITLAPTESKAYILNILNRMGQSCSIVAKYRGKLWTIGHTAPRGSSKAYHKEEIAYHPFESELS